MAVLSDVHLGHRRTRSQHIIQNLRKAFPNSPKTGELDIIFIAGDFYDHLLTLPELDVAEIDQYIVDLMRICAKYGIKLRVLEGTASHDYAQPERFLHLRDLNQIDVDLKYFNKVTVEVLDEPGISVLYVPDDMGDAEHVLDLSRAAIAAAGLAEVDYAIMHGQFEHQLPEHVQACKHSRAEYEQLVRVAIFIGHVHVRSIVGKVHAQGSFDRIAHGEEGVKGHFRHRVDANGCVYTNFVVNEGAMIYHTVPGVLQTLESVHEELTKCVAKYPMSSHIRLRLTADNPALKSQAMLAAQYSRLVLTFEKETTVEVAQELEVPEETWVPVEITPENVRELLSKYKRHETLDAPTYQSYMALLEELA